LKSIVTILGWYGSGNAGDESILQTIIKMVKNNYINCEIVIISHRPEYIEKKYRMRSININDFRNIAFTLFKSELFILGGGGLIKPGSVGYYSTILSIANFLSSKTIVYSVSAIPITSFIDRLLVFFAFNICDYISVRDTYSKKILRNIGIHRKIYVTRDPVLGANLNISPVIEWIDEMKPYITICLRQWNHTDLIQSGVSYSNSYGDYLESLSTVLTFLVDSGYNIVYVPMMVNLNENDNIDHKNLIAKMVKFHKKKVITTQLDPDEIINIISNSELIIGMRYHSIVYSLIADVPVIGLAYAKKVMCLMHDLELDSYCINIKRDFHHEALTQINNILKKRSETQIKIQQQVEIQKQIISSHDTFLMKLVKQPSFKRGIKNYLRKLW
jgi:polysaccharide pyruvyl transferase CsaB